MNKKSLQRISLWGKVLGIMMMVLGGISGFIGLFSYIVGAIPGLFSAFLGYLIFKSGKDAQKFLQTESEEALVDLLDGYGKYLFLQAIVTIVTIVGFILVMLMFGTVLLSAYSY